MKIYFSELPPNYKTYTFPHAVYAEAENLDEINQIYNQGFLPYSGDINNKSLLFYLCRSLRINNALFSDTSENRRVDKKIPLDDISSTLIPAQDWDMHNPENLAFFNNYIDDRFPDGAMPPERLKFILTHPLTTHFLTFRDKSDNLLAVIVCSIHQDSFHYWFAFFDHTYLSQFPIGKWIMWKTIHWANNSGYNYTYLGTCYHSKSLYKARDFKGVEFFNGHKWNNDIKELKRRVHEDGTDFDTDRWRRDGLFNPQI